MNWVDGEEKRAGLQVKADLLKATDDPPRFLTSEQITQASPGIYPGKNVSLAFQTVKDGHVDPVHATQQYLAAARKLGARVLYPCDVTGIMVREGKVHGVNTSQGDFPLDALVSAAGVDTPALMELVGRKLELAHRPGLVVHTTPQPHLRALIEASGVLEFKQFADGRFLTSLTGGPPDMPVHMDVLKRRIDYADRPSTGRS